jgi:hypothetical protein
LSSLLSQKDTISDINVHLLFVNISLILPWKATNSAFASESAAFELMVLQMKSPAMAAQVLQTRVSLVAVVACAYVDSLGLRTEGDIGGDICCRRVVLPLPTNPS